MVKNNKSKVKSKSKPNSKNKPKTSPNKESLWKNYELAVNAWISAYDNWQKTGAKAIKLYADGIDNFLKSQDYDQIKKYNQLWGKAWSQSGQNAPYSWYVKSWESAWKGLGYTSPNTLSQYWQNTWNQYLKKVSQ